MRILYCLGLFLAGSATPVAAQSRDSVPSPASPHYWRSVTLGAATSILLHEAGHISVALALGHPTFGFDKLRPTVYSNINTATEPHKQFLFSAAGLTVQNLLDEAILDVPHARGSAFERGVLGGGIGTTLFYLTIGRTGSVSDVEFIARTHALTKNQATLIYGSVALMHAVRVSHDWRYANFFTRPRLDGGGNGGLDIGVNLKLH